MRRHFCIICGKYRYENRMIQALPVSWVCRDNKRCREHIDLKKAAELIDCIKKGEEELEVISLQHILVNLKGESND